jgi:tryptophanyl-tRNA synthetase
MKKEIIVSGIQPTGQMHIGNYLGALKDWVSLQDKFDCYFFIADLHSLTQGIEPKKLSEQIIDLAETFLAVGLDPEKCTLFIQSHVSAHSELTWIFNTVTPVGELERMTQYKDKASRQKANINMGLLDYPVLQAADILVYKPNYIPVGHDQMQHLEMTNTIARKFNNKYGQTFEIIKPYVKKPLQIMSLANPERKMSKSEPESIIGMFDEPEVIKKRLAKAVTATDASAKEIPKGVANLFELLGHFGNQQLVGKYQQAYDNNTIKYSELKGELAEVIAKYFSPMRETKNKLSKNPEEVVKIFEVGAKKATKVAITTLTEVKKKIGLL